MTAIDRRELRALHEEVRFQRKLILKLARALHTHTRTDLAPDTALPLTKKIVELAERQPK